MYKRDIPTFTLSYSIDGAMGRTTPQAGDYNELSVVSEEFLDSTFRSVFEDLEVTHDVTRVYVVLDNNDPFTVDFKVSLDFIIPSEVPTVGFLIDRIRESFEREASVAAYLFDLNAMSETNPFSATTSFSLVDRAVAAGMKDGGETVAEDPTTESSEKSYIMITFLVLIGVSILLGVAFLLIRRSRASTNNQMDNAAGLDGDEYNADEETMRYLNTIRKRYRDEEDHEESVRSAFADVALPERDTGGVALAPNDASFHHDVENYDDEQDPPGTYGDPAVIPTVDTTLLNSDLARSQSMDSESNVVNEYKAKDFDYLRMELTTASFEEEDLRSIN